MVTDTKTNSLKKFVIVKIDSQFFGIVVDHIIDILLPQTIYPIPLATKEIIGSMNLRGRIVTTLDLRVFLDIKSVTDSHKGRLIVIENIGELFSFIVDEVGAVYSFSPESLIKAPDTLSALWQEVSLGIFPVEEELVLILDINKIIESIVK